MADDQGAPAGEAGPGEAHAAATTGSITGLIMWLLSRYVFHGQPVPPEVSAFVLFVVTYTITWAAARTVAKRRAAKASAKAGDEKPPF